MKHRLEVEIVEDYFFIDRTITIVLRCTTCQSKASLKINADEAILDEQAIRHTIFELCEAHEHAWSTEENHDYTD